MLLSHRRKVVYDSCVGGRVHSHLMSGSVTASLQLFLFFSFCWDYGHEWHCMRCHCALLPLKMATELLQTELQYVILKSNQFLDSNCFSDTLWLMRHTTIGLWFAANLYLTCKSTQLCWQTRSLPKFTVSCRFDPLTPWTRARLGNKTGIPSVLFDTCSMFRVPKLGFMSAG